jgi:hypothetical protein
MKADGQASRGRLAKKAMIEHRQAISGRGEPLSSQQYVQPPILEQSARVRRGEGTGGDGSGHDHHKT